MASREYDPLTSSPSEGGNGNATQMLADKDRRIEMLERRVRELETGGQRAPNWPPCCRLIYINIAEEIPARRRVYMRTLLGGYYFTAIMLLFNCIFMFVASQSKSIEANVDQSLWDRSQWMSLAFMLGIPIAFPLWFYTSYVAVVSGNPSRYIMSFIGVAIGLAGAVFAIIGVQGFGVCGAFTMYRAFADKGHTAGLLVMIVFICWCINAALLAFAFVWQIRYFNKDRTIAGMAKATAQAGGALLDAKRGAGYV